MLIEFTDEQAVAVRNAIYELQLSNCFGAEYKAARQGLDILNEAIISEPVDIVEMIRVWNQS